MKKTLSERQLISKKELAARWGVAEGTIDSKIKEGIIKPVKGPPSPIRFNIEDILNVERAIDILIAKAIEIIKERRQEENLKTLEE